MHGVNRMSFTIDGYTSESVNTDTLHIDTASTIEMLQMINREDAKIAHAIEQELESIAQAVDAITDRLSAGGRMIYIGGGTSGRIGILDAAEVAPYFNVPYEMVQGHIAGGADAVYKVLPGVEDDTETVKQELVELSLNSLDVIVGISSSGSIPYVISAMQEAKKMGCLTVCLVNNRDSKMGELADHEITVIIGPEVITGATALRAGTAQKMILNMISTGVMIKLGRVYRNYMVCVEISNEKLVQRVTKALMAAAEIDRETAENLLKITDNDAALALLMHKLEIDADTAKNVYNKAHGNLQLALQQKENPVHSRIPNL